MVNRISIFSLDKFFCLQGQTHTHLKMSASEQLRFIAAGIAAWSKSPREAPHHLLDLVDDYLKTQNIGLPSLVTELLSYDLCADTLFNFQLMWTDRSRLCTIAYALMPAPDRDQARAILTTFFAAGVFSPEDLYLPTVLSLLDRHGLTKTYLSRLQSMLALPPPAALAALSSYELYQIYVAHGRLPTFLEDCGKFETEITVKLAAEGGFILGGAPPIDWLSCYLCALSYGKLDHAANLAIVGELKATEAMPLFFEHTAPSSFEAAETPFEFLRMSIEYLDLLCTFLLPIEASTLERLLKLSYDALLSMEGGDFSSLADSLLTFTRHPSVFLSPPCQAAADKLLSLF